MLDPGQFRALVVRPAIVDLDLWSQAAENLLVGTALVESRLTHLRQLAGGPALGVFQMEPATHHDLWDDWLRYRPGFAAMYCRLQYRRVPESLPKAADMAGLARHWHSHWNTLHGRGAPEKLVSLNRRHGMAGTG